MRAARTSCGQTADVRRPHVSTPEQPTFSHSGQRYLLGYTAAEYGIWDRQAPGPPLRKFPKTEAGWSDAWAQYQSLESPPAASAPTQQIPAPATAATTPPSVAAQPPTPAQLQSARGPAPSFRLRGAVLAQVLTIAGWALLVTLPLAGIAVFTLGSPGFFGIMQGLSNIALGVGLWGVCLTLANTARRDG
jgi:hypothetical protein